MGEAVTVNKLKETYIQNWYKPKLTFLDYFILLNSFAFDFIKFLFYWYLSLGDDLRGDY